jgi:hypothetical protein
MTGVKRVDLEKELAAHLFALDATNVRLRITEGELLAGEPSFYIDAVISYKGHDAKFGISLPSSDWKDVGLPQFARMLVENVEDGIEKAEWDARNQKRLAARAEKRAGQTRRKKWRAFLSEHPLVGA